MTKPVLALIDSLTPYENNSRTHSDSQIDQLAKSIDEFGFVGAIVIRNGVIAKGHGCLSAIKRIIESGEKVYPAPGKAAGAKPFPTNKVPTLDASGWSDAQFKAYVIADNQLALNADWDMNLLRIELDDLKLDNFDLHTIGFDASELAEIFATGQEGKTDEDDVPEPQDRARSKLGDVWVLGDHRLMCGDSTSETDVDHLMVGKKADFCFTSPPYGQQRDYKTKISDWDSLMRGVYSILPMHEGAQVLVNLGLIHTDREWQPYWDKWIDYMRSVGWLRFGLYVWDQGAGMMGSHSGRLAPSFEFIFHFCKKNKQAKKTAKCKYSGIASSKALRGPDGKVKKLPGVGKTIQETKVRDSIIRVNRQLSISKAGGHPAPFPAELCREITNPWTKPGDVCFEPFSGSGTQIISCETSGLSCYAMELSPIYCDIAVQRWQDFTGNDATNERTGTTFNRTRYRKA